MHSTVLSCTVLRCAVHCTVPYCALHCTVMQYIVPHCSVLYHSALHCTVLRCIVLYCPVVQFGLLTVAQHYLGGLLGVPQGPLVSPFGRRKESLRVPRRSQEVLGSSLGVPWQSLGVARDSWGPPWSCQRSPWEPLGRSLGIISMPYG